MLEVEVKLHLDDQGPLRRRLDAEGRALGTEGQEDIYFQHPSRDFVATDEALRLRRVDDRLELTYKGPRQDTSAKVRTEWNHAVEGDPRPMLEALGFAASICVRKRRASWAWGDVTVVIDEVAGLGTFAEIEVVTDDAARGEAAVEAAIAALGLDGARREPAAYATLQARL